MTTKEITNKDWVVAFLDYIAEWEALERAYYRIPNWRFFKQLRNIHMREKLTKDYSQRWLNES